MYPTENPDAEIIALYQGPYRCGPEVVLYRDVFPTQRRLGEPIQLLSLGTGAVAGAAPIVHTVESQPVEPTKHEPVDTVSFPLATYDRGLVGAQQLSDPELCYNACKEYFAPDNRVFIFQVYWEDNQKLCSCCRVCTEQIPVQFAQVFTTSCPSSKNGLLLDTAGYTSSGMIGKRGNYSKPVKPGAFIKYRVRVFTVNRNEIISNFGVQISLPPYVSTRHVKAKPRDTARPTVLGNSTVGTTISFNDVTVTYKRPVKIKLLAKVSKSAPYGTPLTITAATFTPGVNGEPTCLQYGKNTTVHVVGRRGRPSYKVDHPKPLRSKIKDKVNSLFSKWL